MDIIQFQNKLKDIQTLAMQNGKKVQAELVEKFFDEEGMDSEKLQKVYDFLEIQGIRIEGRAESADKAETSGKEECESAEKEEVQAVSLTKEEEEYLREYLEGFGNTENLDCGELLSAFTAGHQEVKEKLICCFQSEVVKAARELNREDVFFGDLLQEGNMGLLLALEHAAGKENIHEWLCGEIKSTIRLFLEEQTQQKKEDDILVEKVRDLEKKVKELTEDEDVKYSVEELAAFLDMDVEEMESVLRLTGEDK